MSEIDWRTWLLAFLLTSGAVLALALALLAWVLWRVRRIRLPEGTGFFSALRVTPLIVVILLDMLDLSLDFLSAPIAWTLLGYLGLSPLRGVTVVESLIPGTQLLPTMTLSWILSRLLVPESVEDMDIDIVEGSWRQIE